MPPVAGALTPTLRPQRLRVLGRAREQVRSVTIGEPTACHRFGVAVTTLVHPLGCGTAHVARCGRWPRRAAVPESTAVASAAIPSPDCSLPDSTRRGGGSAQSGGSSVEDNQPVPLRRVDAEGGGRCTFHASALVRVQLPRWCRLFRSGTARATLRRIAADSRGRCCHRASALPTRPTFRWIRSAWLPAARKSVRLSDGHSRGSSTSPRERVFKSFP